MFKLAKPEIGFDLNNSVSTVLSEATEWPFRFGLRQLTWRLNFSKKFGSVTKLLSPRGGQNYYFCA